MVPRTERPPASAPAGAATAPPGPAPWLPSIVPGATLVAVPVGTWPAPLSAFVPCRRHLRRRGGSTTDFA
jgi:hypothetical protein